MLFKIFLDKFPKFDIKYTAFYRKKKKKWKNPMGRNQNDKKFYI